MKSFKLKYSPVIWILLALVILLSVCGLAWNLFTIIEFAGLRTYKVISAGILCALCLALTVLSLSVVFYGKYSIKGNHLYSCFGIIKSKIDINVITHVIHFKKSDKLVVYFENKGFLFFHRFVCGAGDRYFHGNQVVPAGLCQYRGTVL